MQLTRSSGGKGIEVRSEYYQNAQKRWRWRVFAIEDNDGIAEARSGAGFDTKEEAEENFRRASLFWSDTERGVNP